MPKLDFAKEFKTYYKTGSKPEIVEFDEIGFLALQGMGDPNGETFTNGVEALYPLAYGIKKVCKEQDRDFGVPKLEGQWWVEGDTPALEIPKSEWFWKLLIRMPDFVNQEMMLAIQQEVATKKNNDEIRKIAFEKIHEGKCVQIMHIGPYADEPTTLGILMEFISNNGLSICGLHHEIYISDPRRTEPSKMKTILRYPVK